MTTPSTVRAPRPAAPGDLGDVPPARTATASRTTRLLTVLRWALNAVVLVWIARYFLQHRAEIVHAVTELDARTVGGALLLVLLGLLPGAWAWQRLCADRLPGVTVRTGILVYLRSAVGKYTPAGVLTFVIQLRFLERHGARSAVLVQVFVVNAVAACLFAGFASLPAALALGDLGDLGMQGAVVATASVLVAALVAVVLRLRPWPPLSRAWSKVQLPSPRVFVQATLLLGGAVVLTGAHLAVLGARSGASPVFLVSAYALSTIFGLVFAVLPGAFGARDGALLFVLASQLAPADAATLAILSRTLVVAGDVVGAVASAAALRLGRSTLHHERSTV